MITRHYLKSTSLLRLRQSAAVLYRSVPVQEGLTSVKKQIDFGHLQVKKDVQLHADLGMTYATDVSILTVRRRQINS